MAESLKNFDKEDRTETPESSKIGRRQFLKVLGGAAAILCLDVKKALAQEGLSGRSRYEKGWFYKTAEMQKIYGEEYNRQEKPLKNTLFKRGEQWIGTIAGEEFVVPEQFINRTLVHLRQMLESNTALFLFRLDAFHGHFFVPEDIFDSRYKSVDDAVETTKLLVEEDSLGVLYHNSEHFEPDPHKPEEVQRHARRNVVGYYDGRPLLFLPLPKTIGTAANEPEGNRSVGPPLTFAAHKNGAFHITVEGKEIRLDISLDDAPYF